MIWVWLKELSILWRFMKIKIICPHMDTNKYGNRICLINPRSHGFVPEYEWCDRFRCPKVRNANGK